jgi:hypothetical protein
VTSQEIDLQRGKLIGWDGHFSECAESGVDAVHRFGPRGLCVDDRARRIYARDGRRGQTNGDAVGGHTLEIVKRV